jgi:3'-5' exoribonuclease
MDKQYVNQLVEGGAVDSTFVVKSKRVFEFKQKPGHYLSLVFSDKSGEIAARMWDRVEDVVSTFEEGDVVAVQGRVEKYQSKLQVIVAQLARVEAAMVDSSEMLPHTDRDVNALADELAAMIDSVKQPALRALLATVFGDEERGAAFRQAPAAKSMHHAYLGGLLEHTVSVIGFCDAVAQRYPQIDRDLLVAGAALHDIGKLIELKYDQAIEYTDLGQLVGHLVLGMEFVQEQIAAIEDFPSDLSRCLLHMILSHHGEQQFGAVVPPRTLEAWALHYAENMDAKINRVATLCKQAAEADQVWSEYDRVIASRLYVGSTTEPE